jgi:hypothetical protein
MLQEVAMRKFVLSLLVLVLAVPAVAVAATPEKKPKPKPTPVSLATAKNAAQLCKALRAANPALFARTFGTNHNMRNAYGKCVSAKARSRTTNPTVTLKNVIVATTGTVTNGGAAGCQLTAAGCTLTSSGTVAGAYAGTYTATFTVLWQSPQTHSNGAGGFCAPTTGTVVLTLTGLGTITKTETGEVCEVGATGMNVPHTFTGTFTVASGTGLFAGATGTGTSTFNQQPGTTSATGGPITASETFQTLTFKL